MPSCQRRHLPVFLSLIIVMLIVGALTKAQAQSRVETVSPALLVEPMQDEQVNLNLQLHLIVASNDATEKGTLPQSLEQTVRTLRASLPYANYRETTMLTGRVRNGGNLTIKGVANALFPVQSTPSTPIFYEWNLRNIKIGLQDGAQIEGFNFYVRMPVVAGAGKEGVNSIQYESAGVSTSVTLREGEPAIVGTMNVGRADQLFILIATVQRAGR